MKRPNLKIIMLLLSILCSICLFSGVSYPEDAAMVPEKDRMHINPLRKYIKFKELRPFRDKVGALIQEYKKKGLALEVSVYFRSLSEGIWFGIDEKKPFCPASLMKVPVMMTYLRLAEKNHELLDKKIKYETQDLQGYDQGMNTDVNASVGKYYSVDELIELMITKSDNNADAILLNNLPPGELKNTFASFGVDLDAISGEEDFISLKACCSLFRVLYNASYLNEDMSEKALHYLIETKYPHGMSAGLPKDIAMAHKFGERAFSGVDVKQLHEVGIIYYPNNPYILGIMTKGTDYSCLNKVIKDISALVYKEVDSQYKAAAKDTSIQIE